MPLWGGRNFAGGNTKPSWNYGSYYAIPPGALQTLGAGNFANSANIFGVTANGYANASGSFSGRGGPAHAGWVALSVGRGFVRDVDRILAAGNNIANGATSIVTGTHNGSSILLNVTSVNGNGAIGNVLTVNVRSGGVDINTANAQLINVCFANLAIATGLGSNSYITVLIGGRAGRIQSETLVAMGSLTGTDANANVWFTGNF